MQLLVLSIPLTKDAITSSLTIPPTYPFLSLSPFPIALSIMVLANASPWSDGRDKLQVASCTVALAERDGDTLPWDYAKEKKNCSAAATAGPRRSCIQTQTLGQTDRQADKNCTRTVRMRCTVERKPGESLKPKQMRHIHREIIEELFTNTPDDRGRGVGGLEYGKQEQYIVPSSLHSKQSGLHLTAVNIVFWQSGTVILRLISRSPSLFRSPQITLYPGERHDLWKQHTKIFSILIWCFKNFNTNNSIVVLLTFIRQSFCYTVYVQYIHIHTFKYTLYIVYIYIWYIYIYFLQCFTFLK